MYRIAFALLGTVLSAQVPAEDVRNTRTPNTDTHFTMREYRTLKEWEARKSELRKQVLSAAGLFPVFPKTPLNPQIFGRIAHEDYSIEKVLLETMPGYYLGGNLYRPTVKRHGLPAVATPHGHWDYGRLQDGPLGSIPARCINLARQGYVVFAYDMVGWNDTVQTPHAFGAAPEEQLWSFGPLGVQLWNSIRVIDFLQSLPEVDPAKIAMTGASGGGTQTFLACAIDERVRWAAPVNMISAIMQGGSPCENAPGLRVGTNNMEIGAMMAPRPLLMVSATGDWTKNTPKEEFPAIQSIYRLYGEPGNVDTIQIDAPHNYNKDSREAVYRFFGKHVLGVTDAASLAERGIHVEKLQDMLALHNRTLPANALDFDGVFRQWRSMSERQFAETADVDALRERLRVAIGARWPASVAHAGQDRLVLSAGDGDRVPALRIPGTGAPAVVVHPDGADAARESAEVKKLISAKRPVLLIDAFQTGKAVAPRDRSHKFFLTFNRSDDANRVQDILTALRFVDSADAELIGIGKAAVWCTFAAAIAPVKVKLSADTSAFKGSADEYARDFFVPGIQRAGGLRAAKRVLEGEGRRPGN